MTRFTSLESRVWVHIVKPTWGDDQLLVYINLDPAQPATAIKSYNWIYPVVDAGFLRGRGRKMKKGTTWTHHCSESQVLNLKVKRRRFTVCNRHVTWHKPEIYTFLISLIWSESHHSKALICCFIKGSYLNLINSLEEFLKNVKKKTKKNKATRSSLVNLRKLNKSLQHVLLLNVLSLERRFCVYSCSLFVTQSVQRWLIIQLIMQKGEDSQRNLKRGFNFLAFCFS